jgi:hypothetical protein
VDEDGAMVAAAVVASICLLVCYTGSGIQAEGGSGCLFIKEGRGFLGVGWITQNASRTKCKYKFFLV